MDASGTVDEQGPWVVEEAWGDFRIMTSCDGEEHLEPLVEVTEARDVVVESRRLQQAFGLTEAQMGLRVKAGRQRQRRK